MASMRAKTMALIGLLASASLFFAGQHFAAGVY